MTKLAVLRDVNLTVMVTQ